MMCAFKQCDGGMDYCCETDCGLLGGPRLCEFYKAPATSPPVYEVSTTIPPTTEAPVYEPPVAPTGPPSPQDKCVGDCAFCKPHDNADMPLCSNGEYQWACVSGGRGHRVKCPSIAPMMCAYKICDGGMDYCCETDCGLVGSEPHGGPRLCEFYKAPATTPPVYGVFTTKAPPVYKPPVAPTGPPPPQEKCVGDCAFCKPHDEADMPSCLNGEYSWSCVSGGRGHRVQCPSIAPMMCAFKECDGGMDYCCETDCGLLGGPRLCEFYEAPATSSPVYEVSTKIPPTTETPVYEPPVAQTGPPSPQDKCVGDCAFCKPHDNANMPLCSNGEYQWACESGGRGHRVQCPSVAPMMCAYKKCDGGMDYCCETDCGIPGTEPNGGPRLCDLTHPLTIATRP